MWVGRFFQCIFAPVYLPRLRACSVNLSFFTSLRVTLEMPPSEAYRIYILRETVGSAAQLLLPGFYSSR
jgi:hypothetical protein